MQAYQYVYPRISWSFDPVQSNGLDPAMQSYQYVYPWDPGASLEPVHSNPLKLAMQAYQYVFPSYGV